MAVRSSEGEGSSPAPHVARFGANRNRVDARAGRGPTAGATYSIGLSCPFSPSRFRPSTRSRSPSARSRSAGTRSPTWPGLLGGWFYARRLAAASEWWKPLRQPTRRHRRPDRLGGARRRARRAGRLRAVLQFRNLPREPARRSFAVWRGGMSFHGGFLGAVLAIVCLRALAGPQRLAMLDLAAVVTPIGLFFGRIANFINGELWGRPAPDFPYAVVFPPRGPVAAPPEPALRGLRRGLVLFVVMAFAVRRFGFRRPGLLGGIFVLGYAVARIVCEFFREPDPQLGFLFGSSVEALGGGITMGMLLSLPMALWSAIAHLAARRADERRALSEAPRRDGPSSAQLPRADRPRGTDHGRALHGSVPCRHYYATRDPFGAPATSRPRRRSARCSAN